MRRNSAQLGDSKSTLRDVIQTHLVGYKRLIPLLRDLHNLPLVVRRLTPSSAETIGGRDG